MMRHIVNLINLSRPRFWLYLAGTYVIGYLSGANEVGAFLTPQFWLYMFYFLLPANIFLYGVNDLADGDTDQYNEKKNGYETRLENDAKKMLTRVLRGCVAITIILAFINNSVASTLILGLFIFLSFAYSQKPFRWKARPIIDSASNILYILPGILGYYLASGMLPSGWIITGFGLWTAAMHLFSAIPDIKADSLANLRTTAVVLGQQKALILCFILWLIFAIWIFAFFKLWWLFPVFIYPFMPLISIFKVTTPAKLYKSFPYLNAVMGFLLFWGIFFYRF